MLQLYPEQAWLDICTSDRYTHIHITYMRLYSTFIFSGIWSQQTNNIAYADRYFLIFGKPLVYTVLHHKLITSSYLSRKCQHVINRQSSSMYHKAYFRAITIPHTHRPTSLPRALLSGSLKISFYANNVLLYKHMLESQGRRNLNCQECVCRVIQCWHERIFFELPDSSVLQADSNNISMH